MVAVLSFIIIIFGHHLRAQSPRSRRKMCSFFKIKESSYTFVGFEETTLPSSNLEKCVPPTFRLKKVASEEGSATFFWEESNGCCIAWKEQRGVGGSNEVTASYPND